MPGWYEIKELNSGNRRFLLKTTAHGTLLESGYYPSQEAAEHAINSLRGCCGSPERFKRQMASSGKNFFVIRDNTGAELLKSKLYDSEATRDQAIATIAQAGLSNELRPHA
ncbi:DUF1508 domain-containing protein [Pseudomonas sp. NY15181]|uniref:DUF1508 domain-containing protein n=1 Tax=Pseudomonas sp. NY15181 TaxID=3400349 RepID=UPI003A86F16A